MRNEQKTIVSRREFVAVSGAVMAAALTSEVAIAKCQPPTALPPTNTAQRAVPPPQAANGAAGDGAESLISEVSSAPVPSGAAIDPAVIEHAEQLAGITFTPAEREMMSKTLAEQLGLQKARRASSITPLNNDVGGSLVFNPLAPGEQAPAVEVSRLEFSRTDVGRLPTDDLDIAYSPVTSLSHWIRTGKLSVGRLTRIYLERLKRIGPKLECVITLMEEQAMARARRMDVEIAAGDYRGPLHGIPWGAKDIIDTAGVPTTWGAEPFRDRVPENDAAVVKRLDEAGAILIAKLSLGALAYDNIWFGGKTRNPWNLEQGSSGSSAGSAAATAAGCVGFALGTETLGSIVSPSMRCGVTGLRPTFGRVPRDGCMALCWSYDKIGPITRTVEDAMVVLGALNAACVHELVTNDDARIEVFCDASVIRAGLSYEAHADLTAMRVGWNSKWFEAPSSNDIDRTALEVLRSLGVQMVEVSLPDWPYDTLLTTLFCEAAAAFEELTRSNRDDELTWQEPQAWPNTFRQSWFIPGIELVQADRFRRKVCEMMRGVFRDNRLNAIIAPSYAANLLVITNNTGHPSLTIRAGFMRESAEAPETPHGITLIGDVFREGPMCAIGRAMERKLDVWKRRPGVE